MLSEKFEIFPLILELPYNIGICTNIAHTNSLHPPNYMLKLTLVIFILGYFFNGKNCRFVNIVIFYRSQNGQVAFTLKQSIFLVIYTPFPFKTIVHTSMVYHRIYQKHMESLNQPHQAESVYLLAPRATGQGRPGLGGAWSHHLAQPKPMRHTYRKGLMPLGLGFNVYHTATNQVRSGTQQVRYVCHTSPSPVAVAKIIHYPLHSTPIFSCVEDYQKV